MTKQCRSSNEECSQRDRRIGSSLVIRLWSLVRHCVIRHSSFVLLSLSICATPARAADNLGVLGSKPKWDVLENYQRTIMHDEFVHLINDVYCTHGIPADLIKIDSDAAQILTNRDSHKTFTLQFASDPNSKP